MTSCDHALRLTVWTVIATEALLFAVLLFVHGYRSVALPSPASIAITLCLAAACIALAAGHRTTTLSLGAIAMVTELFAHPHGSKLTAVLAGLHAAHIAAGLVLVAWLMAVAPRRRTHLAALVSRYWYFVLGGWLLVWPLFPPFRA